MLTDEQKAAGWIEHDGGPKPQGLPAVYYVMIRHSRRPFNTGSRWNWREYAKSPVDIIAYRPEQQP
ncbi:hypothetical protein UFOVP407_17 [uncultured Caudovirales phage]|uniref:Uncharacterized protein n=1 Tax=uncultured Caudovirales phage TaxID=2100421 RepID=A0A6J5M1R0_9CAUD|nr:hypothetical protein UFOVP407_17 [uncultured Caudovirales phage]